MYNCLITCKSITAASRIERLLNKNGCLCSVVRPSKELLSGSCGYGIRLKSTCLHFALRLIRENSISYGKVYNIINGKYEEIHDLS